MRSRVALLLLSTLLLSTGNLASALYMKGDAVVELNSGNFDKLVMQADGVAVVEFYAPWCGHCKQLAPQYKKAAANLQGLALVGAVDCNDMAASGALCKQLKLQGFPTIKLYGSDKIKNPYTGKMFKEGTDYTGPRTAKPIVDAVTALLTDLHITRLQSGADLDKFVKAAAGKPQVLLFTNKAESTVLYKSLSTQLRSQLAFGEVQGSAAELVSEFGVQAFPTLLVVKTDGTREVYGGELKAPALLRHLSVLGGLDADGGSGDGDEAAAGKAAGKEGKGGKAAASAFVRQVYDLSELPALDAREDMALLALHGADGPDGCSGAREGFLEAAGEMQAVVDTLLVSVPGSELTPGSASATSLERMGVDVAALGADPCEPQVVLLPLGKAKADLDDYQVYSGPAEGKALQRWVTDSIPTYFVTRLDDSSGGSFLALDPSRGRMTMAPKVVLFTSKDEAPGLFRALAMTLRNRGNLLFAWVQVGNDLTKKTVSTFNPTKVPSMTIIVQTPAEGDDDEVTAQGGMRFGQQPYFGALKFAPMRSFLEEMATAVETASGIVEDPELAAKALPQVASQTDFEQLCTSKAGLCLLSLLDSAAPTYEEERQELLKMALQAAREGSAFHFVWMEGRQHRGILEAFGVLHSDLPTMVALSSRRMRFAVLSAPEDAGSGPRLRPELVSRFIDGVLAGKVRTQALQALPEILSGGEGRATGREGAEGVADAAEGASDASPVEEEFDLSDILSEEVEGGASGGMADRLKEVEEQIKAEEEARKAAEAAAKKKSKKSKKGKKGKSKASASEEL